MNHGFKLHTDGTLEITIPKGVKVGRVLVCEAGTQDGMLMYPDENAMAYDEFIKTMDMAIEATNTQDSYSLGMRNGFMYAKCIITGEKPEYEKYDVPDTNVGDIPISWSHENGDLISRHGVSAWLDNLGYSKLADYVMDEDRFPSAQSEPAIPLSWIEGQINWLKSLDNAFSTLTAVQISAMVNKWRGEQND